ncbi:MAG: arylamine N-acetyltransferase [Chitinophagales bacterium]
MNITQYLQRIKYDGIISPIITTLNALQKNHLLNVPFENLDIHYGRVIVLNVSKFFEKVVIEKRGGFCYELNGLFFELLQSMGFEVKMVSARVYNGTEKTYSPEYDHLAIIVKINSTLYLADVGFGEFTLQPLKIELNEVQKDERGNFKIQQHDDEYLMVAKQVNDDWIPEYIFSTRERALSEFTEMCIYNQTSPQSHFTQKKLCSIATDGGRITLTTDLLKISGPNVSTLEKIDSEEAFAVRLEQYFYIKMS